MSARSQFLHSTVHLLLTGMVALAIGTRSAPSASPAASGGQLTSAAPTAQPTILASAMPSSDAAADKPAPPEPVPFGGSLFSDPS